jgi:Protein of unknown function (DUF2752)
MFVSIKTSQPGETDLGLIFGAITLLSLILLRFVNPFSFLNYSCPFLTITHYPCPACGSIHAICDLAHFQLISALSSNPLVSFSALLLLFWGSISLVMTVSGKRLEIHSSHRMKTGFRVLFCLVIILNWSYLVWFKEYFQL